jgi:hypothetical protein
MYRVGDVTLIGDFRNMQCIVVQVVLNCSLWTQTSFPGGGGGNTGMQIRRSAQIWSKIRRPTMVLSMKSQSRIRTKLQAKSTIRAKILDKSAIRCINKIRKSV